MTDLTELLARVEDARHRASSHTFQTEHGDEVYTSGPFERDLATLCEAVAALLKDKL